MSGRPALTPGQPVGDALQEIAATIVAQAQAVFAEGRRDPTKTVHDIRRAMKRWRGLVRMLMPFLGEEGQTLRENARDLARKLSVARDAQSAIDAFQDAVEASLEQPIALRPRTLLTIQRRLETLRAENERLAWTDDLRREMSSYLDATAAQVAQWDLQVSFCDVADTLAATYRRARRAIPESWSKPGAEDLHELRRRLIDHRYQMELIAPLWPRLGRLWVNEAQRLRTRLGKYQDLEVLAEKTAPHQPLSHWRAKLAPLIAYRQAEHVRSARRVATRLFAERPKAFRRRIEALWEAQTE